MQRTAAGGAPGSSHGRMIRVLAVSDIRLYREGLAGMIRRTEGIEVVGTAARIGEVEEVLELSAPDVILLDMGVPHALAAVRRIREMGSTTKVLALGVSENRRTVMACAEAGVSGYVCRESSLADLIAAVEGAVQGELHCSPRISAALLRRVTKLTARLGPDVGFHLTPREAEIAELLDEGLTNQEIGSLLSITVSTVKVHVHNILSKIGAHHRGEAAVRLRRLGLIRPGRSHSHRA